MSGRLSTSTEVAWADDAKLFGQNIKEFQGLNRAEESVFSALHTPLLKKAQGRTLGF